MKTAEKEEVDQKKRERADELNDLRESEAFKRPSVSYGSNQYYGNREKTQSTKHFIDNLMRGVHNFLFLNFLFLLFSNLGNFLTFHVIARKN